MNTLEITTRTQLKRAKERGNFDRSVINDILDDGVICHVGYVVEGRPVVIPTCHWRDGDSVYWHGSRLSRTMLDTENADVCVTVTHLDGLVLARSAFHHSANYRSVVVFGRPEIVDNSEEKAAALKTFVDGLFPGRWNQLRPMSRKEADATTVLRLPISEASAKVRQGKPSDLDDDLTHPVWAGVIPVSIQAGTPEVASDMTMEMPVPASLEDYRYGKDREN